VSSRPLRVHRLEGGATLPTRAHPGDAGLDLHALEGGSLDPGARRTVTTGLAIEVPEGQAGLVLPRSGLAARAGITVVNAPGLIDSGYRGELRVLLLNTDRSQRFTWSAGDRIAQLVLVDVELAEVVEVDELSPTPRGAGGLGSTGR
jgi:dUTP pyrophosphatase